MSLCRKYRKDRSNYRLLQPGFNFRYKAFIFNNILKYSQLAFKNGFMIHISDQNDTDLSEGMIFMSEFIGNDEESGSTMECTVIFRSSRDWMQCCGQCYWQNTENICFNVFYRSELSIHECNIVNVQNLPWHLSLVTFVLKKQNKYFSSEKEMKVNISCIDIFSSVKLSF